MQTKEPRVVALTLEILDKAMLSCGNPLHIQVATKEFMNVLVTLLNQKNFPSVVSVFQMITEFNQIITFVIFIYHSLITVTNQINLFNLNLYIF